MLYVLCFGADTKKFRTSDSIKLIEYTFKTYSYFNLQDFINTEIKKWNDNNSKYFNVNKGISDEIHINIPKLETPIIPIIKENIDNLTIEFEMEKNLNAPIYENSTIGKITVLNKNKEEIFSSKIISSSYIPKKDFVYYFSFFFKSYPKILENLSFT